MASPRGRGDYRAANKKDAFLAHIDDTSYDSTLPVLSVGTVTAPPLSTATVSVPITFTDSLAGSSVSAISMTLSYDALNLEVQDVVLNSGVQYTDFTRVYQDLGNGQLYVMVYQSSGATVKTLPSATAVVAVTFRVKYTTGSSIFKINIDPTAIKSTSGGNVDVPVVGILGLVQVVQRCGRLGDCDCSGAVKLWEVQQAVRLSLGQYVVMPSWYACVVTDYSSNMQAADLQKVINNHLFGGGVADAMSSAMCRGADTARASLKLGPSSIAGSAMVVPIRLQSAGQPISTLVSDIEFDATGLSVWSVSAGMVAVDAGKNVQLNISKPGKMRVVVTSTSGVKAIDDGEVGVITFAPLSSAGMSRGALIISSSAADPNAEIVPVAGNVLQYGQTSMNDVNLLLSQ